MRTALTAGLLLLVLASTSYAADSAVEAFHNQTAGKGAECSVAGQIAILRTQAGQKDAWDDVTACVSSAKADAKLKLQAAVAAVSKKPLAVKALKDYYVAWIASLDGIQPDREETKSGWSARQDAGIHRYREAWTRVDLEL